MSVNRGDDQWVESQDLCQNLQEVTIALNDVASAPVPTGRYLWLFRGQAVATWDLRPTIERRTCFQPVRYNESNLITDFRAHARLWSQDVPEFDDMPSWLSLMRHHGVPTRLLDWSYSPFVALFFALEEYQPLDGEAAVWALNATLLASRATAIASELLKGVSGTLDLSDIDRFKALAFYAFDGTEHKDRGLVAPMLPRHSNVRFASQQGTFLINCNHQLSFSLSLRRMMSGIPQRDWLRKIVLGRKLRLEALDALFKYNVHPVSLFPDLDGLGRFSGLKGELYPAGTFA